MKNVCLEVWKEAVKTMREQVFPRLLLKSIISFNSTDDVISYKLTRAHTHKYTICSLATRVNQSTQRQFFFCGCSRCGWVLTAQVQGRRELHGAQEKQEAAGLAVLSPSPPPPSFY